MNRILLGIAAALAGCLLLAVGLVWGQHRSVVDWGQVRALVLASDDWGLCGFLPDSTAIAHVDREALSPGNIPEVYWHSTLEDSASIAALGAVLGRHRGRDDLPAILQPNYILASLAYHPDAPDSQSLWTERELPDTPPGFERPGLWQAVRELQAAGLWHPELHGRWHYDPAVRIMRTAASPAVQAAAARQIIAFPDIDTAWELDRRRDRALIANELQRNLSKFEELFGRPPRSIIAPDYLWDDTHERLWIQQDLRVIQGQRQQQRAEWRGERGRVKKILHRVWTRWWRADRNYIDRNCLFEPVQHAPDHATTDLARADVLSAWQRREPAVLQVHRINFVHLDPRIPAFGRAELDSLLTDLTRCDPVFLVDGELAALARRGTSWVVRGDRVIARNLTRSRRLLVVPAAALREAAARAGIVGSPETLVLWLEPGETRVIGPVAAADA